MSETEEDREVLNIHAKLAQVSKAFRPGAPVDTRDLFAGRTRQMNDLIQCVMEPYMHPVVFGERGVGKTSLVTVVGTAIPHVLKAIGAEDDVALSTVTRKRGIPGSETSCPSAQPADDRSSPRRREPKRMGLNRGANPGKDPNLVAEVTSISPTRFDLSSFRR